MLILGIDTSCDDTSASVVEDGRIMLSNIVSGQEAIHRKYGGIVPELASRRHLEMIWPVADEALESSGAGLRDISAVAVCRGPGLIGSLLVGCSFAKSLSYSEKIPLVAVNHLEGHILSCFLNESRDKGGDVKPLGTSPEFPFISLIVSGGHTSLYRVDGFGRYSELGRSRDDAAGEAYDKVSKLLGLGYPGGPVIDRLANDGDPESISFPRAYLPESLDFSFSGIKTAVVKFVKSATSSQRSSELQTPNSQLISNIAASFQSAVVEVLVRKSERALEREGLNRLVLSGGVAANSALRRELQRSSNEKGFGLYMPPAVLCTDNAAMIAAAGHRRFIADDLAGMDLNPAACLPL